MTELDAFWQSIWDFHGLVSPTPPTAVLAEERMPGARWFPGAQLNYARQVLRHVEAAQAAGCPAIVHADEAMLARGELGAVSWRALSHQVAHAAAGLRALGVRPGDRVCAVLPNTPQTAALFLAVASLGAVWSVCAPDMGPVAVLDRFRQIEPVVLLGCDRVRWGGMEHDKRGLVDELLAGLPSVRHALRGAQLDALLAGAGGEPPALEPEWLPFDHPLWIVYSSGTTGLPKPIVHGHGGVILEGLKTLLMSDIGPAAERGDRFHWFSTTGWIMWNCQVAGLLAGATICLFDGSPSAPSAPSGTGGREPSGGAAAAPDWSTLWRFAGLARATVFGAGAAFYASCLKADVRPAEVADLSALRAVGSTGSPLSDDCHDWLWSR
ncbi:MAG: hypothetical protein RLZZ341_2679, partial [Pseudomonadota bacterium]